MKVEEHAETTQVFFFFKKGHFRYLLSDTHVSVLEMQNCMTAEAVLFSVGMLLCFIALT